MKKEWGFTLIELLITLVIFSLLSIVAIPFVQEWSLSSQQIDTRNHMIQAIGTARSYSIQNSFGVINDSYATRLDILDNHLTVKDYQGHLLFTYDIPSSVVLKDSDNNILSCLEYNNRGLLINDMDCSDDNHIRITNSSLSDLYVNTF